jgi:predicted ester cyclase
MASDDTAAENEAKTRDLYERVWNQRDLDLIESWVTPDFIGHWSAYPEPVRGVEGFRRGAEELLAAFPDLHVTVEETVAAGDKVVSRIRMSGTHTGPMLGFQPTHQRVEVTYLAMERYADGLCVEEWVRSDDLGLSRQIGALPAPGSVGERIGFGFHRLTAARLRRKASR